MITKNIPHKVLLHLTGAALVVLSLSLYTSISIMAGSHILMFIPVLVGSFLFIKNYGFSDIPNSFYCLSLMVVFMLVSIFVNHETITNPVKTAGKLKYFFFGAFSIFPFFFWLKNRPSEKFLTWTLNIFLFTVVIAHLAGFQGMWTGYNWLKMKDASVDRASGLFGQIMTYGYETSWLLVLLLGTSIRGVRWRPYINKSLWVLACLTSGLGLFLSYCRGALLATLMIAPVYLFFFHRDKFKYGVSLSVLVLGVMVGVALKGGSMKSRYLLSAAHDSNKIRLAQWETALLIASERPLWGIGFREFSERSTEFKEKYQIGFKEFESHVHNNYLEILANSGVFAFLCFLGWIVLWVKELLSSGPKQFKLIALLVASFSISGFFQSTIIDGENMFFLMNLYALSMATIVLNQQEKLKTVENP
jgi:O-antigen ligase